jgi:penicillin amidase
MKKLQVDYLSLPARTLIPFLKNINFADAEIKNARNTLMNWNFVMDKSSIAATMYMAWERKLVEVVSQELIPPAAQQLIKTVPLSKLINLLQHDLLANKDVMIKKSFEDAIAQLKQKLGNNPSKWQYGQTKNHHVWIKHPLSAVVDEATRKKLEVGPMPRGGNGSTPGMTTNVDNQLAGATFRMVVDVGDWDNAYFTNSPGQSGEVGNRFYKNLFERWANDSYFPVYFSKRRVEGAAIEITLLQP